ncbi:MAG: formylglycine-generating enzyme family protein, partial [Myxococcales bacterium]
SGGAGGGGGGYEGGAATGGTGGAGGGLVILEAATSYTQTGLILANGEKGQAGGAGGAGKTVQDWTCESEACTTIYHAGGLGGAGGGGAGGTVVVSSLAISVSGTNRIQAKGGQGYNDGYGQGTGAGGAGRVVFYRDSASFTCGSGTNCVEFNGCSASGSATVELNNLQTLTVKAKKQGGPNLDWPAFAVDLKGYTANTSGGGAQVRTVLGGHYYLHVDRWQLNSGVYYRLDHWEDNSGNWIADNNDFDMEATSSTTVWMVFTTPNHHRWTGAASDDWNSTSNWQVYNGSSLVPATAKPASTNYVVVPASTPDLRIKTSAVCLEFFIASGETAFFDTAGAVAFTVGRDDTVGLAQINGALIPTTTPAIAGSTMTIKGDFELGAGGKAHITHVDAVIRRDWILGPNSELTADLSDTTSQIDLEGSSEGLIHNASAKLTIPKLEIDKSGAYDYVTLLSDIGPTATDSTNQIIKALAVQDGALDLAGWQAAANNQVCAKGTGQFWLERHPSSLMPSRLRSLGEAGSYVTCQSGTFIPMYLRRGSNDLPVIDSVSGEINVGPYSGPGVDAAFDDDGLYVYNLNWINMTEGGKIVIDNLKSTSGWDFYGYSGSRFYFDRTYIDVDSIFFLNYPSLYDVDRAHFRVGAGMADAGGGYYGYQGSKGDFTRDTQAEVYGSVFIKGSFTGDGTGGTVIMKRAGGWVKANTTFHKLIVDAQASISKTLPGGTPFSDTSITTPLFADGVEIRAGGELILPTEVSGSSSYGSVKLGKTSTYGGAKVDVYGTLTAVGESGSGGSRVRPTRGESGAYYEIRVFGGRLQAEYAVFEYLGPEGIFVDTTGQIGDGANNYILDFTRFRYGVPNPWGELKILRVDNSQNLVINGARFISNSSYYARRNVEKTVDSGSIRFFSEACTGADTDCTVDISGEPRDLDEHGRVGWGFEIPSIAECSDRGAALNAQTGKIHLRIGQIIDPEGMLFCFWDEASQRPVIETPDGPALAPVACTWTLDFASECCEWREFDFFGGTGGIDVPADDSSSFDFHVAATYDLENHPPLTWTPGTNTCKVGPTDDRTPPSVPAAAVVMPVAGPTDHLDLAWGPSEDDHPIMGIPCLTIADCPPDLNAFCNTYPAGKFCADVGGRLCGMDDHCRPTYDYCKLDEPFPFCARRVDYIAFRGRGAANRTILSLPPDGTAPANFEPVNGEWDGFEADYGDGVWDRSLRSPSGAWSRTGGVLAGAGSGATCRISFNFNDPAYDFANGYLMAADFRKTGGTNGVEIIFKFKSQYARWVLGQSEGGSYWSRIYYSQSPSDPTYPVAWNPGVGEWHRATIYVKGDIARGFADGVKLWELNKTSISGDPTAFTGGTEGFRLDNANAEFDNFFIAPFLYDGPMPALVWQDQAAIDRDGPASPDFNNTQAAINGPARIDLTISAPLVGPNIAGLLDRGTAYYYTVMAVDAAGNTSNLLGNGGLENRLDIPLWQQAFPSDPLAINATRAFEGDNSGRIVFPPAHAQAGLQRLAIDAPIGSILRFSRYYLGENATAGGVYPAAIDVVSPPMGSNPGTSVSVFDTLWHRTANTFPALGTLSQPVGAVDVYAAASGSPTLNLYVDDNRFDIVTGHTTTEGYSVTQVQHLTFEGGDVCNDAEWSLLGAYPHEGQASIVVSDTSGLAANRLRSYRMRSCDAGGHCGPWRGGINCSATFYDCGGVSCTPDVYCTMRSEGGGGYTGCGTFDGERYCVRADGCLPGVALFTPAAAPPQPVATELSESEAQTLGLNWSQSLRVQWDASFAVNRSGTQFLLVAFSGDTADACGVGAPAGYLNAMGTLTETYSDSFWSTQRNRVVTGLATNRFHCFRVMARNGDGLATGDTGGAGDWAGWSPLAEPVLPPAKPAIASDSFALKYGVQDGSGFMRAMIVDDLTEQELAFLVSDANNSGGVNSDIRHIKVRVSPHADFINAGPYQRGYFVADYDEGLDAWTFREETADYGNDRVALLVGDGGSSVGWNGDQLAVTFKWTLNFEGLSTSYVSDQDQGVQIYVADERGFSSDFADNRFGACNQVFHTSYPPPEAEDLFAPPDGAWTNVGKSGVGDELDFWAQGNIDRDQQYQTNLYAVCDAAGVCADWDLDDKAGWFNCIDAPASLGDTVEYRLSIHTAVDLEGYCTPESKVYPDGEVWDAVATLLDSGSGLKFYRLAKAINLASLEEGRYYWCVAARDQHRYAPTGSADTSPTVVPGDSANSFGIDRVDPALSGFGVYSYDPDVGEESITDKDGEWVFSTKIKFLWNAATALANEAPIQRYRYILMRGKTPADRVAPFEWSGADPQVIVGDIFDNGSPSYEVSYYAGSTLYPGEHQFGVQVRDRAGNVSPPQWFDLKIENKTINAPCVTSDTHPSQYEVYCNFPAESEGEIVWNPETESAPTPIFDIIPPVFGNEAEFEASGACCEQRDPETQECLYTLSGSGVSGYSFTLSTTQSAIPDDSPEDDRSGNCEAGDDVCERVCPDENCNDSDQCGCEVNAECGAGKECREACYCCSTTAGCQDPILHFIFVPGSEDANNLYRQIKYFVKRGATQLSGTFYMKVKAFTVAGVETGTRTYRINICGCNPDDDEPCKDATGSRRPRADGMAYFGGGRVAYGSAGEETTTVIPFFLDRTEVSLGDWERCAEAGACAPLATGAEPRKTIQSLEKESDGRPAAGVSWDMAEAYCAFVGKRLPTEPEWLLAAESVMGGDVRRTETRETNDLYDERSPAPVGENHDPQAEADAEVFNLFNNVSEWVSDWWRPSAAGLPAAAASDQCAALCLAAPALFDESAEDVLASRTPKAGIGKAPESPTRTCKALCERKIVRGPAYTHRLIAPDYRAAMPPVEMARDVGFRCAKDALVDEAKVERPKIDAAAFDLATPER